MYTVSADSINDVGADADKDVLSRTSSKKLLALTSVKQRFITDFSGN